MTFQPSVVLVDDHHLVRAGVRTELGDAVRVVGEAGNVIEAVDVIAATGPDCDGDGWTVEDGDCDDDDGLVNPGAPEDCLNELDDDCDGFINQGCDGSARQGTLAGGGGGCGAADSTPAMALLFLPFPLATLRRRS